MRCDGFVGVAQCPERTLVISQGPMGAYRRPVPAYPEQDLSPVMRRIPQWRAQDGTPVVPGVRLEMITVRDGWFAIGDGLDGVVITRDRKMVSEVAMFSDPGRVVQEGEVRIDLPESNRRFGSVFIGFDAAWMNWYHWLCFALARSALAAPVLPADCPVVFPDYAARVGSPHLRYSETTWRQSIEAFGLANRVTLLPPGLYRAEAIRFVWTVPYEPTDVTLLHAFHALFASVAGRQARDGSLPSRILVSREGGDERITSDETLRLNEAAGWFGFTKLRLQELDFAAQVAAFAGAEAVLGIHGAGLANILFGRQGLKVLEVNRPLDGGSLVRPWFYLLAHGRRMPYAFLNAAAGDVTEGRISAALWALGL